MLRRLWGAVLLPIGVIAYILAFPFRIMFRFVGGLFFFLSNFIDFLEDKKWHIMVSAFSIYVLVCFIYMKSNELIVVIIGGILLLLFFSYKRIMLHLSLWTWDLYQAVTFAERVTKRIMKLFSYATLNVQGYGGLSEIEKYKTLNSNYYKNHSVFEERYLKKYGKEIQKRNKKIEQ